MAEILLIDDDVQLCTFIKMDLQERGHGVTVSHSAPAALKELDKAMVVDLVICDVFLRPMEPHLPGDSLDVFEAVERFSSRENKVVPVIAISGGMFGKMLRNQVVNTAEDLGATASLTKPFAPDELAELVERTLMQVKSAEQLGI